MEQLLLTFSEACAVVRIGRSKFYELVRSGEIPVVRIGRAVRIRREDLEHWTEHLSEQ